MKKYSRKRIGFKSVTNEGYELEVIDGSERINYCTVRLGGHEFEVQIGNVMQGTVRNRMHRSVYGVGYLGYGKYTSANNHGITPAYRTWANMIARCYYEKHLKRSPEYWDCTVCDEWQNYQVFAEWFESNYIYGYQLDKDIKVIGNRIYSPEACTFVPQSENIIAANAKSYYFLSPIGEIVKVYNLKAFCGENGLGAGNMSRVHSGKAVHHKQWRKA